jgi:uncharacterized protein (DUF924 family)
MLKVWRSESRRWLGPGSTGDTAVMNTSHTSSVLDFWFGEPGQPGHGQRRSVWFQKDALFDAEIQQSFGSLIQQALAGEMPLPITPLAQIIVLDQFTRNAFRGTAKAFAGDAQALAIAHAMVEVGEDRVLLPVQRMFVYLPFEHAETLAQQDRAVELMAPLAHEDSSMQDVLDYALRHREVIQRFGRFPHRNEALGRASTAEEVEFLQQPGSGF